MDKEDKNKQKSAIRRQVDLDLGITPPKSSIHKNKKKYNRKTKHKDDEESNIVWKK